MKKIVLLCITLLVSGLTAAQDERCRVASNTLEVLLTPDVLSVTAASGVTIQFAGAALMVDGKPRALSAAQQEATLGFDQTLREIIPNAAMIAADATSVARAAIASVADELLVLDAAEKSRLLQPMTDLLKEIQTNASATYFNSAAISEDLEVAMTGAIEPTIVLLIEAYGAALLSSVISGELSAAELLTRISGLRESIDQQIAPSAQALKRRAEAMCDQIEALQAFDQGLRAIEGYPNEGLMGDAQRADSA